MKKYISKWSGPAIEDMTFSSVFFIVPTMEASIRAWHLSSPGGNSGQDSWPNWGYVLGGNLRVSETSPAQSPVISGYIERPVGSCPEFIVNVLSGLCSASPTLSSCSYPMRIGTDHGFSDLSVNPPLYHYLFNVYWSHLFWNQDLASSKETIFMKCQFQRASYVLTLN